MGCGSSLNQVQQANPPNRMQQQLQQPNSSNNLKLQAQNQMILLNLQHLQHIKPQSFANGKCFLFGETSIERKIVMFDAQKNQFSILSSKTRIPSPPIKYQPMEIIYQQSQQLFSSGLFSQNSHPPYNFMFSTFIDHQQIFLCGGVNYDFQNISNEAFLYNLTKGSLDKKGNGTHKKNLGQNLMGTKFQKLSFMSKKRFSHMGSFYTMGKLRYVYIFGGRGENDQVLNHCQKYSIEQEKWQDISPMKIPRCTGFSLTFRGKIYVFGGYSADKKRSKKIQAYDPKKDYWEILNLKLHRGIQAGILCSPKPNQILLIGGNMQSGPLKSTIKVNLFQQSYSWDSDMNSERLLQKGVKLQNNFYIFGGDFNDSMQKYRFNDKKWIPHQLSYQQYISPEDINSFTYSQQTLFVDFDENSIKKSQNIGFQGKKIIILGCDNYPCIIQISLQKWLLKKKSVPMSFRLRSRMSIIQIQQGKYFICGGIDGNYQKASKSAYIYYSHQNKAIQISKMKQRRFDFKILKFQNYIYAIGGRSSQNEYLKKIQRYNLQTEEWQMMPDLNHQRSNPCAFAIGNKILVFGGNDSFQTAYDIQIINHIEKTVQQYSKLIPFSSDLIACYPKKIDQQLKYAQLIVLCRNDVLKKDNFCQMKINLEKRKIVKNTQNSKDQQKNQNKKTKNIQKQKENIQMIELSQNQQIIQQKQDFQFQLSSQVLLKKKNQSLQKAQESVNKTNINDTILNLKQEQEEDAQFINKDDIQNIALVKPIQIKVQKNQGNNISQEQNDQKIKLKQYQEQIKLQSISKQQQNTSFVNLQTNNNEEYEQSQNFEQLISFKDFDVSVGYNVHSFEYEGKYYLMNNKGVMQWNGNQKDKMESKAIINYVLMQQFPFQKFSMG